MKNTLDVIEALLTVYRSARVDAVAVGRLMGVLNEACQDAPGAADTSGDQATSPTKNPPPDMSDPDMNARDRRALTWWENRDTDQPEHRAMSDFAAHEATLLRISVASHRREIERLTEELKKARYEAVCNDVSRAVAVQQLEALEREPRGVGRQLYVRNPDGSYRPVL